MIPFSPRTLVTGLLFSVFWASASVAGKFGIQSAEPLVLFSFRFLLAGTVLLIFSYAVQGSRLPNKNEWRQLTIFGSFNTSLYLGLFVVALQHITPGITSLAIALNPLFISAMTAVWTKRRVTAKEWLSISVGILGVFIAAYPLLQNANATSGGLLLLGLSMIAYSFGSVYYATVKWELSRTTINAWQVFIGGILIVPAAILFHQKENQFDMRFWWSLAWLIFPVSILAVQLWLRLLKTDAIRASLWLYLCPIFGFLYSAILLNEPITAYTITGTMLVMAALYIGQKK
jgi:probable blue pigment (indigoidine) exporter